MKVMMLECTAEELRANRTVMDSVTEAFSGFTRSLVGVDLDNAQVAEALARMNEEGDAEDESMDD